MAAEAYLSLSYSVIPVWGMADPARPKVAGVEWGQYQCRRPTPTEIHQWFSNNSFGGLAIVTGSISRLVVLDFDTQEGYQQFRTQYPDLTERHIVQTRRGFHIYFHLPPHLHLPSRKGQGVDLLADGRYVIARPSCIDGHTYKLIRGGQPNTLTQFDIQRMTRFLDDLGGSVAPNRAKREFTPFAFDYEPVQSSPKEPQTPVITANDLQQMYRGLIAKGTGRNETLFQVSLKARDEGWSVEQAAASLADLHVWQAAPHHRPETPAQRYAEAHKTVQSAFSRPARQQKKSEPKTHTQIPNSVREYLCKRGETRIVRVLDGLRLKGIAPGAVFTTNQALELLKDVVGRDSVYIALKTLTASGQPIFGRENPSPIPPTPANAATETQTQSNKCFIGREEKPGKSPNHRPATCYVMPSNDELCSRLGVKSSHSDPLTLEDLTTAKQTRMALHRELIRRRPGRYPRRWLARRLGVSCETLDSYNRETEGLHFRPCFWEQPIFWSNLNAVPDGIEIAGAFLQDETGKRYPAKWKIAAILIGQGKRLVYKRQDANYYWYGDTPPDLSHGEGQYPKQPEIVDRLKLIPDTEISNFYVPYAETVVPGPCVFEKQPFIGSLTTCSGADKSAALSMIQIPNTSKQRETQRHYEKPLTDQNAEHLAQKTYTQMNQRSNDAKMRISQAMARRLVATYGTQLVGQGLAVIAQRKHIVNPTGFLVVWLRSETRSAVLMLTTNRSRSR